MNPISRTVTCHTCGHRFIWASTRKPTFCPACGVKFGRRPSVVAKVVEPVTAAPEPKPVAAPQQIVISKPISHFFGLLCYWAAAGWTAIWFMAAMEHGKLMDDPAYKAMMEYQPFADEQHRAAYNGCFVWMFGLVFLISIGRYLSLPPKPPVTHPL